MTEGVILRETCGDVCASVPFIPHENLESNGLFPEKSLQECQSLWSLCNFVTGIGQEKLGQESVQEERCLLNSHQSYSKVFIPGLPCCQGKTCFHAFFGF